MANANTVMGVIAGASVIEACALGIGERNGIADLYAVCRVLKDYGYDIRVNIQDRGGFEAYYAYIHDLCEKKTGFGPLNYNTPVFGEAVKTHVAGTHGLMNYGMTDEKKYFLNVLCGKNLVKSFLKQNNIDYDPEKLTEIVERIKEKSAAQSRALTLDDVRLIVYDC
jgi:2-isopropylmalate synthase